MSRQEALISIEDVLDIADDLLIDITIEQAQQIAYDYPQYAEDYPVEHWTYIVELMLDEL
jgi:hypothetical protein